MRRITAAGNPAGIMLTLLQSIFTESKRRRDLRVYSYKARTYRSWILMTEGEMFTFIPNNNNKANSSRGFCFHYPALKMMTFIWEIDGWVDWCNGGGHKSVWIRQGLFQETGRSFSVVAAKRRRQYYFAKCCDEIITIGVHRFESKIFMVRDWSKHLTRKGKSGGSMWNGGML